MLEFDCPKCGEEMEIADRMAGREVRCVNCGKRVEVPEDLDDDAPPRRINIATNDDGLSGLEFVLFGLLFVVLPCANVWVSSILYYAWRSTRPRRASQINMLGFIVFGLQFAAWALVAFLVRP